MDAVDLKILRTMGTDPYPPRPQDPSIFKPSYLAKSAGTTAETVRERLARLEAEGLLRGYQIVPNGRNFGLDGACYYFRLESEEQVEEAMAGLTQVDGVLGTTMFLGNVFCIDLSYRSIPDRDQKVRRLRALAGEGTFLLYYQFQTPSPQRALTNLDWRIIQALRGNALRPLDEVAHELGISAKTVKRRFERIMSEGSAFILPRVDWSKAKGFIPFVLNFYLAPMSTKAALAPILKAFDDRYLYLCVPAAAELGNYALQLFAFSVSEIEELKRIAMKIPGVERVEVLIVRGMKGSPSWINEAIAKKIRETAAKPLLAAA